MGKGGSPRKVSRLPNLPQMLLHAAKSYPTCGIDTGMLIHKSDNEPRSLVTGSYEISGNDFRYGDASLGEREPPAITALNAITQTRHAQAPNSQPHHKIAGKCALLD